MTPLDKIKAANAKREGIEAPEEDLMKKAFMDNMAKGWDDMSEENKATVLTGLAGTAAGGAVGHMAGDGLDDTAIAALLGGAAGAGGSHYKEDIADLLRPKPEVPVAGDDLAKMLGVGAGSAGTAALLTALLMKRRPKFNIV